MKLSNRSFLLAAVLAAVLAAAAVGAALFDVGSHAVATAFSYVKRAADWLTSWTINKTAAFARAEPDRMQPAVQIVRSVAFAKGLMQREHMDMLRSAYLRCPSI